MPSQIVGLENLPNVYITKITMEDNNTESFNVNVHLELKDRKDNGNEIWSMNQDLQKFIKVCLIQTTNVNLSNSLTTGVLSPLPNSVVQSSFYDETTSIYQAPVIEFTKTMEDDVSSFNRKFNFISDNDVENLVVFAFCYLDTMAVSNFYDIELSGELGQYFGALASERIFENKIIVSKSNLFFSPDNTVWKGPVHFHPPTGYMQGSLHSDVPHSQLRLEEVDNLKIVDNRTLLSDPRGEISTTRDPLFSELYYSMDKNTNLSGMFSFNLKQFALTKSKYGRRIFGLSKELFNEFLDTITINSMAIIRQQVKTRKVANPLGTPSIGTDNINSFDYITTTIENVSNSLEETNKVKQIYLNSDTSMRHYSFNDTSLTSKSKGQFKYKVEISIVDKSQEFMEKKIEDLNLALNDLQQATTFLASPSRYNYDLKSLKPDVAMPDSIVNSITQYYQAYSILYKITKKEEQDLISNKLTAFSLGNYTTSVGNRFLDEYNVLSNEFAKKFKIYEKQGTTTKPRNIKKSFLPNLIFVSKEFQDVIQFSDFRRSYDYLGSETEGMVVLSLEDYNKRANMEINRFFDTTKSFRSEDYDNLDVSIANALKDVSRAKFLFFSPIMFNFDNEEVSVMELDKLDTKKLTSEFIKSFEVSNLQITPFRRAFGKKPSRGTPKKSIPKTNKLGSFSVSRTRMVPKINNLQDQETITSSEYLGDNSDFVPASDNFEKTPEEAEINERIESSLEVSTNFVTDTSRNNFDLSISSTPLYNTINSKTFSTSVFLKAPMAFKALVGSRSRAARNNILSSRVDIMSDSDTKIASEILFQSIQKVEVLSGYEKNQNGNHNLARPIWTEIDMASLTDQSSVLCRMSYAEIPELGLRTSKDFRLPVLNQTFVISNQDITTTRTSPSPEATQEPQNMQNDLSSQIKYATTNIVVQSPDKTAIEGVLEEQEQPTVAPVRNVAEAPRAPRRGTSFTTGGSY